MSQEQPLRPKITTPWFSKFTKIPPDIYHDDWKHFLNFTHTKYNKSFLPKGTILYHGSNNPNLVFDPDLDKPYSFPPIFFGLDPIISLWILTEALHIPDVGYLYEFELKHDMNIHYYPGDTHPSDKRECYDNVCLHPQYSSQCHKYELEITEELTIPINQMDALKYRRCYLVDNKLLEENCGKSSYQFDPTNAIISLHKTQENPLKLIKSHVRSD